MKAFKLSFLLLVLFINSHGQQNRLAEELDRVAAKYESLYGFSGNIKVVIDERPVFEKSYGWANRSFHLKNTPETRFSINSISKVFTATAILMLANENKVDLHLPVGNYLPGLRASWKDGVTVHHLLTHSSGLPRESGIQPCDELTFAEQVRLVEKQELLFAPGERYEYSNGGIILLGAVLEHVSGQPYGEFIHQKILRPLELENTGYYVGRKVVENLAVPYRLSPHGLEFAQRSKHYGDNAGGGLYSTASDLYAFVIGLEQNKILPAEYTHMMFQPHIQSGENDYEGYCWSIKKFGDQPIFFAAGSGYGTKSVVIRSPERGEFIAITSNWGNTPILRLLGDVFLTIKGQAIELPSEDDLANPDSYVDQVGIYRFDREELTKHLGGNQAEISLQEFQGRLFLEDELLAERDGFLKLTYTDELQIHFEDEYMIIEINGNSIRGKKTTMRP